MFKEVGTVCVFVSDQERAKDFYTNILNFELRSDEPLYPGAATRWVAVAPEGAKTEIILYVVDENWEHYKSVVGKSQAITLNVDDLQNLYAKLRERGVRFLQTPEVQPWGTYATLIDSEGNKIILVEPPKDDVLDSSKGITASP
jgi:lactoylglutathione lyase